MHEILCVGDFAGTLTFDQPLHRSFHIVSSLDPMHCLLMNLVTMTALIPPTPAFSSLRFLMRLMCHPDWFPLEQ